MKKILHITRNLPPLVGGMERLNWHMADELSQYAKVTVIAPKGSKALKPQNVELIEVPLRPLPLFLVMCLMKSLWMAIKFRPDTILAGSGLTAPIALIISKLCRAKSVVYLHGFDITADNWVYRSFWRSSFKYLHGVIVNSTPTKQLALDAGVQANKITIVHPGVELPKKPQTPETIQAFKQQYHLENQRVLLSVGRLTTRKGLREWVEQALPLIVKEQPNTVLLVVGEAPKNSLGAGIQTVESIINAAKQNGLENHIHFLGVITDRQKLATVYQAADLHVFPVRHIPDDPEGFGMVAIEAAAHGTPTIAFATGGVVDAVQPAVSGYLIDNNDYSAFAEQTLALLNKPLPAQPIKTFASQFAWANFGKAIFRFLQEDA